MTLSVPTHTLDLPSFRNQLEALAVEYGLPMHNELVTSADEMELFGAVNRKFKTLFNRQVECRTFYDYDNAPDGMLYVYAIKFACTNPSIYFELEHEILAVARVLYQIKEPQRYQTVYILYVNIN